MKIILPYPPSTNLLYRTVIKGRGPSARAMPIKTAAYRDYEETVRSSLRDCGYVPYPAGTTVALTLHVYRPRKAGDLSNRIKALEDVIKGIAFGDDNQVIEIHAYRHDDKENPRVTAAIWDVEEVPEENPAQESL